MTGSSLRSSPSKASAGFTPSALTPGDVSLLPLLRRKAVAAMHSVDPQRDPPLAGCCVEVAFLVRAVCGGEVVHGLFDGEDHYWNRLDNGDEIDLTSGPVRRRWMAPSHDLGCRRDARPDAVGRAVLRPNDSGRARRDGVNAGEKRWVDASAVDALSASDTIDPYEEMIARALPRRNAPTATPSPLAVRAQAPSTVQPPSDEGSLVAACSRALETMNQTQSVAVKVSIVRDMAAIKAVAKAYRMSSETQRRSAEIAIICMRSLGVSLEKQMPGKSHRERGDQIGLSINTCCQAAVLAAYSEPALDAVFVTLEKRAVAVGPHGVIAGLRESDPEFNLARSREAAERRARQEESERQWRADPMYAPTMIVWNEFNGNSMTMALEIVLLRTAASS